ncbi:hypothetical protein ASE14_01100 [Agromyces sp. Root81]|uniref:alpha/beta fold hydrolase n=1 Tax=Agromyces sp. Root81 TaxID=1736601 RepID=UPI0006FFA578|nr:alpha/beta hydrolase [Agromyces sp. Root81]KRC62466.1 hypothetical protein ASE14_01100 [Agromyces sp. Root81]
MISGRSLNVITRDGRTLSGLGFGPPSGNPALFIAGAATGKSMSFGGALLDQMNVRLLTMDRPGMGASTADGGRTLASTVDDYRSFVAGVLETSDISIPVVANSQGSVFGLGIAAAGWASRLTLVSPADELAHPEIHAMLPAEATRLSDLARAKSEEAEAILGSFTAEAMEAMVLAGSDAGDRAFYTSPGFLPTYRRSLAEGFASAGAGYVLDTLIAMRAWDLQLDDIECPVSILFGAHDLGHSPDHAATLARRIPGARREVLGDAGGALLWTHSREVLTTLLDG